MYGYTILSKLTVRGNGAMKLQKIAAGARASPHFIKGPGNEVELGTASIVAQHETNVTSSTLQNFSCLKIYKFGQTFTKLYIHASFMLRYSI